LWIVLGNIIETIRADCKLGAKFVFSNWERLNFYYPLLVKLLLWVKSTVAIVAMLAMVILAGALHFEC
jgi:hypothetical protein